MKVFRLLMWVSAAAAAYLFGVYSMAHNYWPIENLRAAKRALFGVAGFPDAETDSYGRLASFPGKEEVSCPAQTPRTMVLLAIGQSNTGNHAGQRYASDFGTNILNYWNGKCYKAQSPLLGTTGVNGESWTLLGNKLLKAGMADQVILVPLGIGGTPISRWQSGGDLNQMMLRSLAEMPNYSVTHVLWHQGESDLDGKTSKMAYENSFNSMTHSLRKAGVKAPVLVSVASKCGLDEWMPTNPVTDAQKHIVNNKLGIFLGPDTDALLSQVDRYDDCHFSGSGQEKFAQAWIDAIAATK